MTCSSFLFLYIGPIWDSASWELNPWPWFFCQLKYILNLRFQYAKYQFQVWWEVTGQGLYRFIWSDCLAFSLTYHNNTHQLVSGKCTTVCVLALCNAAWQVHIWEKTEINVNPARWSSFKSTSLLFVGKDMKNWTTVLVIHLWPDPHTERVFGLHQILSCILPSHNALGRFFFKTVFLCVSPCEIKERMDIDGIRDICVCQRLMRGGVPKKL